MQRIIFLALLLAAVRTQAEVITIGNDELITLLSSGVPLVDVRTAGEWNQTGVLNGSQLVTFVDVAGRIDPEAWKKQMAATADPAQPVILICRSGKRSLVAAKLLEQQDPGRKIYNVRDGINGWQRAILPVVTVKNNLATTRVTCTTRC